MEPQKRYSFIIYADKEIPLDFNTVTPKSALAILETNMFDSIVRTWGENLYEFEGYRYCIADNYRKEFIINGFYNACDVKILKDYSLKYNV